MLHFNNLNGWMLSNAGNAMLEYKLNLFQSHLDTCMLCWRQHHIVNTSLHITCTCTCSIAKFFLFLFFFSSTFFFPTYPSSLPFLPILFFLLSSTLSSILLFLPSPASPLFLFSSCFLVFFILLLLLFYLSLPIHLPLSCFSRCMYLHQA